MIALLAAPLALASGPEASVVHLRVTAEPTCPELDRLYRWLGAIGPGHGGVRTTTGTGVVVGDPPVVLTNHHVVAGARRILLEDAAGAVLADLGRGEVRADARADLAIVALPDTVHLPPWTVAEGDPPGPGTPVRAWGYPDDGDLTARDGHLLARTVEAFPGVPPRTLWTMDVAVAPGMSGGPVANAEGALVGIVLGGRHVDDGVVGLVVPGEAVRDALVRLGPGCAGRSDLAPAPAADAWARRGPCAAPEPVASPDAAYRLGLDPEDPVPDGPAGPRVVDVPGKGPVIVPGQASSRRGGTSAGGPGTR